MRIFVVLAAHLVTDFFAALVVPILPVLEGRIGMTALQGAVLVGVYQACSGLVQPLAGRLSDAVGARLVGGLGLGVAALAVTSVGFIDHYWQLVIVQAVGAVGVGAFHPPAAATVGKLSGSRRSLGLTCFFAAGMGGGVIGHAASAGITADFGVESLIWFLPVGVFMAVALAFAIKGVQHNHPGAGRDAVALTEEELGERWRALWVLYASNVMRFTVNTALVILVVRWAEELVMDRGGVEQLTPALREKASLLNGPMQAALQVGMATGGIALGAFIASGREKRVLVRVPMLGAIAVLGLAYTNELCASMGMESLRVPLAALFCVLCGVGFAGMLPLTFSVAQRLLPHRTSLASGMMMGAAWGPAVVGTVLAQVSIGAVGIDATFWWVAALLAASGVVASRIDQDLLERVA